jgi:hypothetical protein
MNRKRPLYTIPGPSTSFTTEAYFDGQGISPAIRFGYKTDGYIIAAESNSATFLATRTCAERCCQLSHIEGAYDTLVEIEDSPWVEEIRADTKRDGRNKRG